MGETPLHQLKGVAKQPSRNKKKHLPWLVDTLMGDGENQEACSGGISLASPLLMVVWLNSSPQQLHSIKENCHVGNGKIQYNISKDVI